MCHKPNTGNNSDNNTQDTETESCKNVEPLPESFRERRDGPGGE